MQTGQLQPLPFHPVDGLEVVELHGEFGRRQFAAAQRAQEPMHISPWLDTEKDDL